MTSEQTPPTAPVSTPESATPDDSARPDGGLGEPTPPLESPQDVLATVLDLVGPERAGGPALWVLFLDHERRLLPAVLPVDDLPALPHPGLVNALLQIVVSVLQEQPAGGSVAFALVREAGGDRGAQETAWSHALRVAADDADVQITLIAAIGRNRARVLEW
ncbi:hypothetical protein ACTHAM_002694 [Cellulomonas soli]|uniref:hypothetical protein n=1 Tax=Cellulomonas soli TaxID=931535 RepID=UPI003F857C01